jgi:hypothetical protein
MSGHPDETDPPALGVGFGLFIDLIGAAMRAPSGVRPDGLQALDARPPGNTATDHHDERPVHVLS